MKNISQKIILLILLVFPVLAIGQNTDLQRLYRLQDYYLSQLRKDYIYQSEKEGYQQKLNEIEAQIKEKHKQIREANAGDKDVLSDITSREIDLEYIKDLPPKIYASEPRSWLINGSVSFRGSRFSLPVMISAEKMFSHNFSIGGYLGWLRELNRTVLPHPESKTYLKVYKNNFRYNYLTAGVRGSYHFFNIEQPPLKTDPEKVDLYVTGILGYNHDLKPQIFLNNLNNPMNRNITPSVAGINYGAFMGIRTFPDPNFGFFLEAGYSRTSFVNAGITVRLIPFISDMGKAEESEITFKVQIYSSRRRKDLDDSRFKGRTDVKEYFDPEEEMYIYMVGNEKDYASATNLVEELNEQRIRRTEVIAFEDGRKIPLKQARKTLKKRRKLELKKEEMKQKYSK